METSIIYDTRNAKEKFFKFPKKICISLISNGWNNEKPALVLQASLCSVNCVAIEGCNCQELHDH